MNIFQSVGFRSTGLSLLKRAVFAFGAVALALPFVAAPSAANAQGTIAPTREELQRPEIEAELRGDANPVSVASEVERAPCPLSAPQFADLTFTFSDAEFSGLGAIDASLLNGSWSDLVGQEIQVAAICDIRDRAATILRAQGYLAAVQVPVQTIGEGTVKFDVLLARIRQVQVRGDAGRSSGALQNVLSQLEGQEVFNAGEAERYLLLARDIPGLDVRLTLQPLTREQGGQPGDVVGVFDVTNQPIIVDTNIQNYGSNQIGRFGGLARVRINGITGLGDETMVSVYSAQDFDEQFVASAYHEFRVGSEGLTLGLSGTLAFTEPDIPGPNVFETQTFIASAYARYPLIRSQAQNLTLSAGGDFIDQEVEFTGLDFTEDSLRVAFARADFWGSDEASINGRDGYSAIEPKIAYHATLEVRQGVDALGASPSCGVGFVNCLNPGFIPPSRLDADPSGFLVRGEAGVTYRPTPLFGMSVRTRFQYSPDALLGYEQFSGGNFTVGRGYDPGAIIGDTGFGAQFELFYGSIVPETADSGAVQPFVFFDLAQVSVNNVPDDTDRLFSTGGGMRMSIGRQAVLDVTVAVPLEQTDFATSKGSVRALVSLTVQLEPWFN
ncbi:MAG: ShlB/FhaC/HecB family hemolysin secretion/activation protein [Erythrobacter sp.]